MQLLVAQILVDWFLFFYGAATNRVIILILKTGAIAISQPLNKNTYFV
ncbi:hypothetical protein [Nostoc sp. 'Lobaria pulmonaria (5183) cyanobiont']|nr:hypothetical protein [Nostoc sp. 'Lobaria pulmonaria (5183) cyanobiont']